MVKKIHSVVLKDIQFVEIEGEFKEVVENEKKYPLFLSNHSLRRGRDLGIIDSSMIQDLLGLEKNVKGKEDDEAARSLLDDLSEEKMQNVIYLAFIGANPKSEYTLDDFLQRYHGDYTETLTLYMEILKSSIGDSNNKFAAGLRKSTKKPSSKEKK
ncbi:hypothetical protein [Cytobacillus oceanisediminis]|uniref:hypothetical protein n=1 Tax=Cytobacillus oceanisediminis TaxID=665099 RepID=UPI001FB56857|nr:hypothetical protein [Cytobacillus oceanisediminis]UOE54918.1 hypothetical protein IRB79_24565 [Cytobacillus oceanisediminis]